MSAFNVALIGYGYAGKTFHAPLINAADGLHLATVVSSSPAKVHADLPTVGVAASPADVFADPSIDLVVIATPNDLHASLAIAAMEAGKAVVIDKPFAVTVVEARAVMDVAARTGRLASVFHNRRWDSEFLTLGPVLASGALGDIVSFESHFDRFRPVVRDRWREREGPGAGIWYDLGPHLIDQVLVLFGPPLGVQADIAILRKGGGAADDFHAVLRYADKRVVLAASMLRADSRLRLAVHGAQGSFVCEGLDTQEDALKAGASPLDAGFGASAAPARLTVGDGAVEMVPPLAGRYLDYYEHIATALAGRAPNPVPLDQALDVMRVIDLGIRSSVERREIGWGELG